jgi:hypothetical protein
LFQQYRQDGIIADGLAGHLQLFKVLFDALDMQDFKIRLEAFEQESVQELEGAALC